MNRAFALSSIALLLVLLWMLFADYARDWKLFQAQFNRIDVEKTRAAITAAESSVDAAKLDQIKASLQAADADLVSRKADLATAQAELARESAVHYRVDQEFRFTKADLDSMKYEFEEQRAHKSPAFAKTKRKLEDLQRLFEQKQQALLAHQEKLDAIQGRINEITAKRDQAQAAYDELFKQKARAERKLAKVAPDWRRLLLNLPMVDFVGPTLKVKQVVLPDLKNDVNFLQIPRVDRCMTCHVGINQKGFEDAPQPYTTHPRLELFVGDSSKHPMGSFGCTTCHHGQDRGTSFYSAVHTPSSPEQAEEWRRKYGWSHYENWDEPMLPKQHVEAACRKCHLSEVRVPQGTHINHGIALIERYGCYGCHKIQGFEGLPKVGPDLRGLAGKVTPEWALKWIKSPRVFRPSTRMPHFWDLTNTSTPEFAARNNVEADAIVALLFDKSEKPVYPPPPVAGDPARGERLVNEVGCKGCHQVGPGDPVTDRGALRQFGPELNQVGSKTTPGWLFAWLKNPSAVSPTTRMPNLRLSDQEAADITSYLMTLRNEKFDAQPPPELDRQVRDRVMLDYVGEKMPAGEAKAKIASMSEQEKRLFLGDRLLNRYGCFGCHLIKGFETTPGIGVELTTWASKYVDQLDYGLLEQHETEPSTAVEIEGYGTVKKVARTKMAWAFQKLKDPRIFDLGRLKKAEEKLKMPDFGLSDDDASSVVTALISFTKEKVEPRMARNLTPEQAEVEAGRRVVVNRNCEGCHHVYLEGGGGEIRSAVAAALVRYEGKSPDEAETIADIFSPPLLTHEGFKVNPDWFFAFLKAPSTIRPWLKVRMPTFGLSDEDANRVITHFARRDGAAFPFLSYTPRSFGPVEKQAALKLFSKDYDNCWTCHQQGEKKPASPIDSWAPDLTLARSRLRPDWIIQWLHDPQKLQPGTKMPNFYDPADPKSTAPSDILGGDPEKQIEAIRDYIYSLGENGKRRG